MSTKTLRKRIALVAVSAMGFGLLSAAPSGAADVTGTVSAVRYSETAGARDLTPYAAISWTSVAALTTSTATVTLTSAPTASAVVELAVIGSIGSATDNTWDAAAAGSDSLADATGTALALGTAVTAGTTSLAIAASAPGRYIGTVVTKTAGTTLDTVSFDFTTVGAPASYTVTSSAATSNPAGTTTHVVRLLDAAGATTQPGAFDTIALTDGTSAGSFASEDTSISALEIYTGSYTATYTAPNTAATASTLTFTPQGVLVGLGVKTATVTTDSVVIDATAMPAIPGGGTAATVFAVSSPTGVTVAGANIGVLTAAIPTGTSSVTATFAMAANATTYRFKGVASAGTLNGGTTATAFVNATTPAGTGAKTATVTFTLAGNATAAGATLTITQVDVVNTAVAGLSAVLTQTAPSITATSITQSPSGSIVRQLGTSTPITVTVKNNYGVSLGAGYVVNLFRGASVSGGTLISTGTTGADSTAVVSAVNLSTVVSGGSEQYSVQVVPPVGSAVADDAIATIVYTTTGNITSLSVAIAGSSTALATALGVDDTTITDTEATVTAKFPVVYVPSSGTVTEGSDSNVFANLAGTITAGNAVVSNTIRLAADATADNTSTYTTTEGAFVAAAAGGRWNAGLSTLTVAEGATVYVFATKTGLHTVTVTSGGKTVAIRFWAVNQATDYYSVSAVAEASTPKTGSNTIVTVTVRDIFGNVVDPADGLLTATAAGKVRLAGQALSQSLNTTVAGTSAFTVIADATAGAGTITIAPTTTGAQAWLSTYVAPTGAAAPVSSTTVTITVEGAPAKSAEVLAIEAAAAEAAATAKANADAAAALAKANADAAAALAKANADAAAAKAATDKAATDAAIAALKAQLDAAAVKAAADKATSDAAIAAAQAAAKKAGDDAVAAAAAAQAAAVAAAEAAADAAAEATDAANAATDAANASAEAGDAATAAAQDAADAVAALSTQVSEMIDTLKKQITALTNLVIKIQKKVKA